MCRGGASKGNHRGSGRSGSGSSTGDTPTACCRDTSSRQVCTSYAADKGAAGRDALGACVVLTSAQFAWLASLARGPAAVDGGAEIVCRSSTALCGCSASVTGRSTETQVLGGRAGPTELSAPGFLES